MSEQGWMIRKATGEAPFDSKLASIVGPDTEPVAVIPASRFLTLQQAARELLDVGEEGEEAGWPSHLIERFEQARSHLRSLLATQEGNER